MKLTALAILLSLITTSCVAAEPAPVDLVATPKSDHHTTVPRYLQDRRSASRLLTTTSVCSGTQVGPNTLLSASHCFKDAANMIMVDDKPAMIERIIQDNNDHALILISGITFTNIAPFGTEPKQGDDIYFWGNPFVFDMLLRKGYVSGKNGMNTMYDVNGYHGDSGAGIFDKNHKLIGMISYIQGRDSFAMMGSFPINFTADQLQAVGVKPNPLLMTGLVAKVPKL